jgi:hypothetical protein
MQVMCPLLTAEVMGRTPRHMFRRARSAPRAGLFPVGLPASFVRLFVLAKFIPRAEHSAAHFAPIKMHPFPMCHLMFEEFVFLVEQVATFGASV